MAGYQNWVGQSRIIMIPSALSCFTSGRALGMTEIIENAKKFKWSQSIMNVPIYIVPESGLNATYLLKCALTLVAKKFFPGFKHKYPNSRLKKFDWGIHSVSKWTSQDLCLVSLKCELLKGDFCDKLPILKLLELDDDVPLNVIFPFC